MTRKQRIVRNCLAIGGLLAICLAALDAGAQPADWDKVWTNLGAAVVCFVTARQISFGQ